MGMLGRNEVQTSVLQNVTVMTLQAYHREGVNQVGINRSCTKWNYAANKEGGLLKVFTIVITKSVPRRRNDILYVAYHKDGGRTFRVCFDSWKKALAWSAKQTGGPSAPIVID
jgi:hypothetical protein